MPSAPTKRFWHLESFTGGLDRRDGTFTKNQNRFYDLVNYRIVNSKKAVRRPPCGRNATAFVNAQGCILYRGNLYTVAKKGDVVTKPSDVTGELRFDTPDHCTTWELAGLETFGGFVVALIKHDMDVSGVTANYPGGVATHQYRLHVFDGKKNKPTYVEDPWCPVGWGPSLPLHLYRIGDIGTFSSTFVPRMAVCSGRLYISTPDGRLNFCKTGNARTWTDRTVEDIHEGGEWYYFFTNSTPGLQTFTVSDDFSLLNDDRVWSAYVFEYLDTNGKWQQIIEDTADPVINAHYYPKDIASRFGGPDEISLRLRWTAGCGFIIRFRMLIGNPPFRLISPVGPIVPNKEDVFSGNGAKTSFATTASFTIGTAYEVYVNGVLQASGVDYAIAFAPETATLILFTVAPPVGVNNVRVFWSLWRWPVPALNANAKANVEYEGISFSQYAIAPLQMVGTTFLYGIGGIGSGGIAIQESVSGFPNGQTRYITRFSSRVTTSTIAGAPAILSISDYHYGYETGFESSFFLERTLRYQLELSGADDAGDLPTASQQGADGGFVTALSVMKDRLLVSYKGGTQLWQVSGLPDSHALIGFGPVGTGLQAWPVPSAVSESIVVGMARGLMSLNLSGSNLDSLRDINLGEPIQALGFPQQTDAVFWPETGQYITAVTMPDASRQFLVFDHSPEQKINAWSRWTVASLPVVERHSMVAFGNKLYFRAGGYLYNFNLDATDYIDVHDAGGVAFQSTAMLHFNHLEAPFRQKQAVFLDWVMSGNVTVSIRWNPDLPTEETGELVYAGMTAGRAKVPVSVWGTGLAPVIRSRDRAGHTIEELGMWFIVRER